MPDVVFIGHDGIKRILVDNRIPVQKKSKKEKRRVRRLIDASMRPLKELKLLQKPKRKKEKERSRSLRYGR